MSKVRVTHCVLPIACRYFPPGSRRAFPLRTLLVHVSGTPCQRRHQLSRWCRSVSVSSYGSSEDHTQYPCRPHHMIRLMYTGRLIFTRATLC